MSFIFLLVIFGIAGGVLAGLLGIGGGIVYVLILPHVLIEAGIPENMIVQFTIANSLFGIVFASLSSNLINIRRNDFYLKESLLVSIPGSIASLAVIYFIVTRPWYNQTYFNGLLVIFLMYMLVSGIRQVKHGKNEEENIPILKYFPLAGFSGGTFSALSGMGGGAIVVPILTTQVNMDIKKARSISLVMIFITSAALTSFNALQPIVLNDLTLQYGYIYLPVALPLTLGVLIGSPFGSRLGAYLSSNKISFIFGLLLLIVILEKSFQFYRSLL